MLVDHRPLLLEEMPQRGDEIRFGREWRSQTETQITVPAKSFDMPQRTCRPLPALRVKRAWNCPSDVPGPICWLRVKTSPDCEGMVVCFSTRAVTVHTNEYQHIKWTDLGHWDKLEYSTDRKTWKACEVEEDAK